MNRKVVDILDRPSKWCQNSYSRLADGSTNIGNLFKSTSWCLGAAIDQCYGANATSIKDKVGRKIKIDGEHLHIWNDDPKRTYEDVINLCKKLKI